jgi:hypothetical protein
MSKISELVEDFFQRLVTNNDPIYGSRSIPCEIDAQITDFVNIYMRATEPEREETLSNMRADFSDAFFVFSERMAALAVRERSRERIVNGLVALLIEDFKFDFRDSLRRLAPLYHSALKIDADPSQLFLEASSYGHNDVARAISEFPNRAPHDRSLESMAYKEEQADGSTGFRYISTLGEH